MNNCWSEQEYTHKNVYCNIVWNSKQNETKQKTKSLILGEQFKVMTHFHKVVENYLKTSKDKQYWFLSGKNTFHMVSMHSIVSLSC